MHNCATHHGPVLVSHALRKHEIVCNGGGRWTLPDFAATEDTATIVPYTCDEMVSAAAKFMNTGISPQNIDNIRAIQLVGDATHDKTWQEIKLLRIGFGSSLFY